MVRILVGPCGEGANCTMHLMSSGRRSEALGLPLGRLVAMAACMRGVGTPCGKAGDRSNDEALCLLCLRLLEGVVFWIPLDHEFFHISGSPVVFDAARGASF